LTAQPNDPAGIMAMLERAFFAWKNREPVTQPRTELIRQYDRRRLVEAYGRIMPEAGRARSE